MKRKIEKGYYNINPIIYISLLIMILILIGIAMYIMSIMINKTFGLDVKDSNTTVVQAEIIDKKATAAYVYKGGAVHTYTITIDSSEFLKDESQKTFQVDMYTYLNVNKGDWIDCDYTVETLENGKTTKSLYLHTGDYGKDNVESVINTEGINTTE